MPYAKVRGATTALDVLAKTVAIPRDNRPIRLPTYPALERTAVLSFTDTLTLPVPAGGDAYAFLARDPVCPLWAQCYADAGAVGNYSTPTAYSVFRGLVTEDDPYTIPANTGPVSLPITGGYYAVGFASDSLGRDGQGAVTRIPMIRYEGQYYMLPVADNLGFEILSTAATFTGATYSIAYDYIKNGTVETNSFEGACTVVVSGTRAFATHAFASDTGLNCPIRVTSVLLTITGANAVVIKSCGVGFTTQSTVSTSQSPLSSPTELSDYCVYPVTRVPERAVTTYPWRSTRSTAVGCLFTNVTAVLNKEGTIEAGRCLLETFNPFKVADYEEKIDSLYPKDRYFGAMENGLYTFTLPDAGSESLRDCIPMTDDIRACLGGKTVNPPVFDLSLLQYANLIIFKDLGSTSSTIAVTLDRHIEFRSTSVLFPVGFSTLPLETFHASQMALVRLGVFFENPVHLAAIAGLVRTAVQAVAPYVMPVLRSAGRAALNTGGEMIMNMAKKKMGNMQQNTMVEKKQNKIVVTKKAKTKRRPRA